MQEPTDDQLDGLFRKSAEEFDPPFDPAAWQDMQARLDSDRPTLAGPPPFWKNLVRWGLPVLLLLLLGSVWYIYRADNRIAGKKSTQTAPDRSVAARPDESPAVRSTPTALTPTGATTSAGADRVSGEKARSERQSVRPAPAEVAAESAKNPTNVIGKVPDRSEREPRSVASAAKPDRIDATKAPFPTYKPMDARRRGSSVSVESFRTDRAVGSASVTGVRRRNQATAPTGKLVQRTGRESQSADGTDFSPTTYARVGKQSFSKRYVNGRRDRSPVTDTVVAVTQTDSTAGEQSEMINRLSLPTLNPVASRPGRWSGPAPLSTEAVQVPAEPTVESAQQRPAVARGLSVRLLVAPDLSAVGLRNFSRPGTNVGLLLEYRLGPRWSIQTGVLQSTKVYRAATSDYNFPYNWMVTPNGVNGRCSMLDIPVNVRYDFVLHPQVGGQWQPNRWFVSGGLTSYYIEKEVYTFVYDDPTNPHIYPKNRGWDGSTGGYGLSQLNFSVGYERSFSRRLSWQVEPFLKVPLKGVGNYKIDLLSTGVFFSVRYKL